jgi:hypothetical protein
MSRSFSTYNASVERLKVSLRCGCSPKARQMRWTVDGPKPAALAMARNDQWVAPGDAASGVTRDHTRHGTGSLFAALDVATGAVIGRRCPKHRSSEFRMFRERVEANDPADLDVHLAWATPPPTKPSRSAVHGLTGHGRRPSIMTNQRGETPCAIAGNSA